MTAPNEVWIDFEPTDYPSERVMYGDMPAPFVGYVLRDPAVLAALPEGQAMVADALERAADSLLECSVWCDSQERTDDGWRNGVTDARKHHMARIRALIPTDHAAARAARDAASERRGMERAAKTADATATCILPSGHFLSERVAAAIRAEMGGEA